MDHAAAIAVLAATAIATAVCYLTGQLGALARLSPIPFLILGGMAAREFLPEEQTATISKLSILGMTTMMFVIGLEFSPRHLIARWRSFLGAGAADLAINAPIGWVLGWLAGLDALGATFFAVLFYPTSTAIVSRTLIDSGRLANPEAEHALNTLVAEDLVLAVALVGLAALAGGGHGEGSTAMRLLATFGFIAVLVTIALFGRKALEWLIRGDSDQVFLFGVMTHLLVVSAAAMKFGLSEAVGALLAGMMLADSAIKERIERLVMPISDYLAGLFFLSFGLLLDWRKFDGVVGPALMLAGAAVVLKVVTGIVIGRMNGLKHRARWRLGFLLVPRGEFSVVIAATAATLPALQGSMLPQLGGLFVLVLAIGGALLIARGDVLIPAGPKAAPRPTLARRENISVEVRKL